ncbi:MAG: gamma-glutamyltransferase [Cyanobacteria bacterium J06632_22]
MLKRISARRHLFLSALTILVLLGAISLTTPAQLAEKVPVSTGRGGAVASVDRDATQVGINVLRAGGNAVDAAVATAAALGVTEPFSAGIGGGGFMVIRQPDGQVITLDGREEAPALTTPDMFEDPDSETREPLPYFPERISSGLAVGVPGTLLNWETALRRYGTLSLGEALQGAIAIADTGFTVDDTLASQIERNQTRFAAFTSTRDLYLPNGAPPAVGSNFTNPDLADTYRQIAAQGTNVFYRGALGEAIVKTVQSPPTVVNPSFRVYPGRMVMGDLDRYEVRVRPPIVNQYRGFQIYGMGLPSSGGITVAQTLELLEDLPLGALPTADAQHYILAASRLAYADRNAYLGDPEYVDVPLLGLFKADYLRQRAATMTARQAGVSAAPGNPIPFQNDPSPSLTQPPVVTVSPSPEGFSTTHLTVADAAGQMVSYTLTIESTGGSGIVVPGHGFILNNELTDFNPVVPHPNTPEPGKRPRSSMSPTIMVGAPGDGQIYAFGSPGGSTIITTVLGIVNNLVDFGQDLPGAIAAPRLSQRNTTETLAETGFEEEPLAAELIAQGHQFRMTEEIGAATGVGITPEGEMIAVAEPLRRGGGSAMVVERN